MLKRVLFALLAAFVYTAAPAAEEALDNAAREERPENAPKRYDEIGEFKGFERSYTRLELNGLNYAVASGARVYDISGNGMYLRALQEGMIVGLIAEPGGTDVAGRVVEIWVLPGSYWRPN